MILVLQKIRLIPIILFVAAGLFTLKLTGILLHGGYTLGAGHMAKSDRSLRENAATVITRPAVEPQPKPTLSWAQDMFGYPEVTGSVAKAAPQEGAPSQKSAEPKKIQKPTPTPVPSGAPLALDPTPVSPAERALLERLSERRQELEKRQSELDMRDTLLKAAEKRLETRINELKDAEARIVAATQHKEEAELQRLKNLVTMYESMKAKDAAKIFERLDLRLATEVAKLIQPRRMSDILAQMSPETAQRLTGELANSNRNETKAKPAELPKIEGRPSGR